MRMPRDLGGRALVRVLVGRLQNRIVHERGSHVVIETETPAHHRIAIPDDANLRTGTLNAILKAVAHHRQMSKQMSKQQILDLL